MKSRIREFAKAAALTGGLLLGAVSSASAQNLIFIPHLPVDPVKSLDTNPACLSFKNEDRAGHKFDDESYHQYDELLVEFSNALKSYSRWDELKTQLENMKLNAHGVCFYNQGKEEPPITFNRSAGTFEINIINYTPWGAQLQSPEEVSEHLDLMIHVSMYNLHAKTLFAGLKKSENEPEFIAFIDTLVHANAHAEAVLLTMERGLAEDRLEDLADILYNNSPAIPDEISDLYVSALDSNGITDEARSTFKAAVFKSWAQAPRVRYGQFDETGRKMRSLASQGSDVSKLFNVTPSQEEIEELIAERFGSELAELTLDGKSLFEAYKSFWSDPAKDPATGIKAVMKRFKEEVEKRFKDLEEKQNAEQDVQEQDAQGQAGDDLTQEDNALAAPAPAEPAPTQ